ncbi:Ig-like domain-containing protein [Fulvivirga sediminis]|uniref:Choice-of-anchor D domain-containing protein n=1 Tax=Fulvivirga sediminis TaxID=2803949 RepID=A0A937FCH4_9BACT|nr:choice-of-anchor D domain-containing protein [Fulvivirga sediminis]MBL3658380.1 choice-of-anchor D domain-containing protein [Fulvivirga sediminis]
MKNIYIDRAMLYRHWLFLLGLMMLPFLLAAQSNPNNKTLRLKLTEQAAASIEKSSLNKSSKGYVVTGFPALDALNAKSNTVSMKRVFAHGGKYEAKHRKYGLHLWYEISYPESSANKSMESVRSAYERLPEVQIAEVFLEKKRSVEESSMKAAGVNTLDTLADDPQLDLQWHYNNTGQTGGTAGADISLFQAWGLETGSNDVIVAVIDGGIDVDHADLEGNMWVNDGEIPGNGIDDDDNGYIDDINGYNFADGTGQIPGDTHGTHVGGTVAAETNNGVGVAGVAGGSGADDGIRLMSCTTFGVTTSGGFDVAFIYAADNGAVIAQNSWGYTSPGNFEQSVLDAIDYFIAEAGYDENGNPYGPMQGGVVIFAAGNSGSDNEWYPGYYEPVLAVAGTDHNDNQYTGSNRGDWVEVAAPAVNVYSTLPNNQYGSLTGTSMACPHVSGVAALIVSKFAGNITPQQVWSRIIETADELSSLPAGFGSGRLNAFNALQENDGTAPEPIDDLAVADVYQNSIILTWTAPSDPGNGSASIYDIRYSTEPITEENFSDATQVGDEPSPSSAGTLEEFEIDGLRASSTFYFAIKSADFFGNVSEISNIASGTTENAPVISIVPESLDIDINVMQNPVATADITLMNEGDGANLEYTMSAAIVSQSQSFTSKLYPGEGLKRMDMQLYGVGNTAEGISTKTAGVSRTSKYHPYADAIDAIDSIAYDEPDNVAEDFVGLTNGNAFTSAVRFDVEQAVFTLTHVKNLFRTETLAEPTTIVEIYSGENLGSMELLLSQEVNLASEEGEYFTIPLEVPQTFYEGDVFWVVAKFPTGIMYPQGFDTDITPRPNTFFYSADGGSSYSSLPYALKVRALSASGLGVDWITFDPVRGSVAPGESEEVTITFDASSIGNGEYGVKIIADNNDPSNSKASIPATVTVSGQMPDLVTDIQFLEFGSVLIGNTKEMAVSIVNDGFGDLELTDVSVEGFAFDVEPSSLSLAPGEEAALIVSFSPSYAGNINGTLNITSNDPSEGSLEIPLVGVGTSPPVIGVTPEEVISATLDVGDSTTKTIEIINYGNYPLTFSFPELAVERLLSDTSIEKNNTSKIETIELSSKDEVDSRRGHPVLLGAGEDLDFGYRWIDSDEEGGPLYTWDDISSTGTEIIEGSDDGSTEIELPFTFEFYGEEKNRVIISSNGYLTFGTDGTDYTNDQIPSEDDPNDFIAPFWDDLRPSSERGNIYYQVKSGRLIVQYQEVGNYASSGTATFQVVLYSNGSINFFYSSMSTLNDNQSATVGIENADATDGLQVVFNNAFVKDSLAVSIMPPQPEFITDADPLIGVVPVNSSVSVEVTLNATGLYDGEYTSNLLIASNDPFNPVVEVPFELTAIGYPLIHVEPESIEFDTLFIDASQQATISVINEGSKALEVSSMTNSSSAFEVEFDGPVSIEPGSGINVPVIFSPESEGLFTDEVVINSDDSDGNEMLTVSLSGVGVTPPAIVVSPDSIFASVEAGEMAYDTITIENTGGYELIYSLAGTYWFKAEVVQQASNAPIIDFGNIYLSKEDEDTRTGHPVRSGAGSDNSFGYTWADNKNGSGPSYDWHDIEDSGVDITDDVLSGIFADGDVQVPIGFDFNFYGNTYDSVWVSANGLLSFSEISGGTASNSQIPTANSINNIIAGLWDDLEPGAISGTVVYESSDDMLIVQFTDVARYGSSSEGTVTFQMIIYKNGNIKLQYADVETASFLNQSTIGIENATGTDGAQVAFNTAYLEDELVVLFEPPVMGKVAPGEMVTVAVTLDASDLNDGVYEDDVIISSNDPETPEVSIPVTLTVSGMPDLVALPDTLDFGEVYVHEDSVFSKTMEVTLSNPGSKVLTVDSLFVDGSGFVVEGEAPFTLDPDDELTLSVTFMPESLMEYSASLIFYSDSKSDSTYAVTLLGEGVAPPVFTATIPGDSLYIELKSDEVVSDYITVANNGGSLLTYDATVQYSLGANASSFAKVPKYAHITASDAPIGLAHAKPVISAARMDDEGIEFTDSIAYDPNLTAEDYVGIPDETLPFSSATKFEAPASGFTLTHVRNFFRTEGSTDPVVMEVYAGGDNPVLGELVTSQEIPTGTTDGQFELISLNSPQSFDEGEVFWVVFHYPVSIIYSQGINSNISGVEGLFMYSNNGGVSFTPAEVDIPGVAFKVRALESVSPWLTLDPEAGEVAPAEEEQIEVTVSAADAGPGDHSASITIASNDPFNPLVQIPVQVHVNQVPEFVEYPTDTVSVYESKEISITFKAEDYDGEILVYTLEEMYPNVTFKASADSAVLKFKPDFEQSGYYTFTVAAIDNSLETTTVSFVVEVIDVNRPPMIVGQIPIQKYNMGGGTDIIDLSAYITDPDMEPLTYTVTAINDAVVDVDIEGKLLFITPLKQGKTYVSIIASDEDGDMVGTSFEVRVRKANASPVVVKQTENQDFTADLESVVFNLSEMFEDPDGDVLSYNALSSDEDVVTVVLAEDMLILVKHNSGESEITVDAQDGKGGAVSTTFLTKVGRVTGVEGAFSGNEIGLTSYPNPMYATSTLRYSLDEASDVNVQILTTDGRMIRTIINEKQMAGDHDVMHDRKGLREGLYLYRIQVGDQVFYRRLAVSNQ